MHDKPRLRSDFILLLAALIWGSAFVAQRSAAQAGVGVFAFNAARFFLGGLALVPFAWRVRHLERRHWFWIATTGVALFAASALQQLGLRYTTAGNAGFITGLYVVIVPLILWLSGREHLPGRTWLAVALATLGIYLLSTQGALRMNPGDALELGGAFFWALHVLLLGYLARQIPVAALSTGQFFICALLNLSASILLENNQVTSFVVAWGPILYTGLFSIGLGYSLQALGQRHAPATDAALILSTEAIFAALAGYILLGEHLTPEQLLGCVLILMAVLLATWITTKAKP